MPPGHTRAKIVSGAGPPCRWVFLASARVVSIHARTPQACGFILFYSMLFAKL